MYMHTNRAVCNVLLVQCSTSMRSKKLYSPFNSLAEIIHIFLFYVIHLSTFTDWQKNHISNTNNAAAFFFFFLLWLCSGLFNSATIFSWFFLFWNFLTSWVSWQLLISFSRAILTLLRVLHNWVSIGIRHLYTDIVTQSWWEKNKKRAFKPAWIKENE